MRNYLKKMKAVTVCPPRKPFSKIAWSCLGGFFGIYGVSLFNEWIYADTSNSLILVGSLGASGVLIYGAPQAEYSQPRNLVGGQILSALTGISVYQFLPFDVMLLGAIAVSLSIVVMHYTRTLHPPGGATALIAVIGSSEIHHLGYMFVLSPITMGTLVLLLIALVVNNLSANPKRHYPQYWW